ncbi:fimbrial protein [Enterobacteriaceae bacterium 4M9]|nr:fimbrial protein [Enterobacteriaceae bacterium 4M9]
MKKLLLILMMAIAGLGPMLAHAQDLSDLQDIEDDGQLRSDSCRPYNPLWKRKRVQESRKSLELSTAFMNKKVVERTWSTGWAGKMTCYGTGNNVYLFTALNAGPLYVHFMDAMSDNNYWIKFDITITGPEKLRVKGGYLNNVFRLGNYQTSYKLRAELLDEAPGAEAQGRTKATFNGITSLVPIVMSGDGGADYTFGSGSSKQTYGEEAWAAMLNDTPASGWNTKHYVAFETLSVQFSPNQTTCSLAHDVNVMMPPVTLAALKKDSRGQGGEKSFTLPIVCRNPVNARTATRSITAWIASNDVVGDDDTGEIMINDDSDEEGVGVSLRKPNGERIIIANGIGPQNGATPLLTIQSHSPTEGRYNIPLVAYYQVFDRRSLSTGHVVATAQVMFGYD